MTVYGVGQAGGMTSGPTKAIVAAVLGIAVSRVVQRPDDVSIRFRCRTNPDRGQPGSGVDGAYVFNLPGEVADGRALAAAIETAVPGGSQRIEFEPGDLAVPVQRSTTTGIETVDTAPATPLAIGVAETRRGGPSVACT